MKLDEAKQASSEAIKKSRRNGDRVDQIIREADVAEGEVQRSIRRFTQRLKRYRARLEKRTNGKAPKEDAGDNSEGGE